MKVAWNPLRIPAIGLMKQTPRSGFFSKLISQGSSDGKVKIIEQRVNDGYNSEYLDSNFNRYLNEISNTIPLNSYNNTEEKFVEAKLLSHKTIFRMAGQSVFDEWAAQYERLLDAIVESDHDTISEVCEKNLADKFLHFLQKIDKSSLKCEKVSSINENDQKAFVHFEFESHRTVEGVSLHRNRNLHASQYFQTPGKESLQFSKVTAKKQSKWVLFNLSSNELEKDQDGEDLHLNQYMVSLQTNLRLNLVKRQDPTQIVYGSDDKMLLARHLFQIENVRGRQNRKIQHYFTDIDSILNGNPFISAS